MKSSKFNFIFTGINGKLNHTIIRAFSEREAIHLFFVENNPKNIIDYRFYKASSEIIM